MTLCITLEETEAEKPLKFPLVRNQIPKNSSLQIHNNEAYYKKGAYALISVEEKEDSTLLDSTEEKNLQPNSEINSNKIQSPYKQGTLNENDDNSVQGIYSWPKTNSKNQNREFIQDHHEDKKVHKCLYCNYRSARKGGLNVHLRTHTGEKPYKCSYCDKSFAYKNVLQYHLLIHTGEKPHNCFQCDKSFVQKTDLKRHLLIHTGEKPYKCTYCDKSFAYKNVLQDHLLIHTGEKPHKCPHCDYKCITKSCLKSHLKHNHAL